MMKRLQNFGLGSIALGEAFMFLMLPLEGDTMTICGFAAIACIAFGAGVMAAADELKGRGRHECQRKRLQ